MWLIKEIHSLEITDKHIKKTELYLKKNKEPDLDFFLKAGIPYPASVNVSEKQSSLHFPPFSMLPVEDSEGVS